MFAITDAVWKRFKSLLQLLIMSMRKLTSLPLFLGKEKKNVKKGIQVIQNRNDDDKIEQNDINKYCKCVESYCNCCREFRLPVVELHGPGNVLLCISCFQAIQKS